jgi:hypothetical protein
LTRPPRVRDTKGDRCTSDIVMEHGKMDELERKAGAQPATTAMPSHLSRAPLTPRAACACTTARR